MIATQLGYVNRSGIRQHGPKPILQCCETPFWQCAGKARKNNALRRHYERAWLSLSSDSVFAFDAFSRQFFGNSVPLVGGRGNAGKTDAADTAATRDARRRVADRQAWNREGNATLTPARQPGACRKGAGQRLRAVPSSCVLYAWRSFQFHHLSRSGSGLLWEA